MGMSIGLIRSRCRRGSGGRGTSVSGQAYVLALASACVALSRTIRQSQISEERMVRGASRRNVIGGSSRIAEESPDPSLFDEVMHLAHPTINGDGLPRLFLRPMEPSGASHIGFPGTIGLDQSQLSEDMG